jgi:MSHA biogenesis protein MshO
MSVQRQRRLARGFTLVEAIVVIVIIGILGAIVAVFIKAPVQGYADSVARAETSDEADLALRRMAREIRLALPNSVRVSPGGDAIEFLPTTTGGRYLAVEDAATGGTPLDFVNPAVTGFTVVGGLQANVAQGDYVVVFNLGPGMAPADAYELGQAGRNIAQVDAAAARGATELALKDNPFARDDPMPSPGRRFHVVRTPVTFQCAQEGTAFVLRRYAAYPIRRLMTDPMDNPASAVLARRVASCDNLFRYDVNDAELRRSALVLLTLGLHTRGAGDAGAGVVRLVHQVHVDNTP